MILINKFVDSTNFYSTKSSTTLQPDRVKPEFGNFVITLNMDMLRFVPITCIKEKPIGSEISLTDGMSIIYQIFQNTS